MCRPFARSFVESVPRKSIGARESRSELIGIRHRDEDSSFQKWSDMASKVVRYGSTDFHNDTLWRPYRTSFEAISDHFGNSGKRGHCLAAAAVVIDDVMEADSMIYKRPLLLLGNRDSI